MEIKRAEEFEKNEIPRLAGKNENFTRIEESDEYETDTE